MRTFDFISVKLALSLILGIILGHYLHPNLFYCALALAILIVLLGIFKRIQKRNTFPFFGVLVFVATVCLGVFVVTLSKPSTFNTHYSNFTLEQNRVFLVKVAEVMKPTSFSERYVVKVKRLDSSRASGRLLLSFPMDTTKSKFKVDDEFAFVGNTEGIKPPLNPHQFDYRDYLRKQGIYHQVRLDRAETVPIENPSKTLVGIASNFREGLIEKLKTYPFGNDELGVIQALLLGNRDDISEATYNDYKNAGAVHILAVSGLHVGIILLLLNFLLQPLESLPKGKQVKSWVIIILLWAFAFVAGLSPSIVRAVTMFSFLAYAMHLNRPTNTFNIIALSMFAILLVSPMFLFQAGFQMSYAAVIAIVWIYPKLQRFWHPENWLVRKVWQLLSVSVAAQLGVLPISLFYFHQFPALFFVSNLVIVPFLGIILGMGIFVIFLAGLNLLSQPLVAIYNFLISKMNAVIHWVGEQEGFVFRDIPFDVVQLVLGYFLILGAVLTLTKPKLKNISLCFASLAGLLAWGIYNQIQLKNEEQLLLAHQTRNSIMLYQHGRNLKALVSDFKPAQRIINDFKVAERIKTVDLGSLKNSYHYGGKQVFVIDSSGVYPVKRGIDYLILTQSPKINLGRLLDSIRPKMILADGSNYKSYVQRWKETCAKRKLPFYYTAEGGAFLFKAD